MEEAILNIDHNNILLENISLEKIFIYAVNKGLGTAVWRNPSEKEIHIIVHFNDKPLELAHPEIEHLPSGFLVSPYENENNLLNYFIKADLHIVIEAQEQRLIAFNQKISLDRIYNFIEKIKLNEDTMKLEQSSTSEDQHDIISKEKFENLVKRAIDKIVKGEFQKVVPSRSDEITLSDDFNIISKFISLCETHPTAFASLFSIPDKGIWIGASPELLIRISDKKYFYTSAVAGTQSGKHISNLSEVAWTQKEIEEQAFVSRYIVNCFKKIRLREFEENGPRTVKAGGLVHLRTDYQVDLEAVNFPQLGSVMMKLLHPTSAVCGMPKEPASTFLKNYEKIFREFYCGYLGPVNISSESSLYVNLRCAKIHGNKATLFAGAGVTRDSIADKEWRETELKMSTIKDVLLA